ncbi:ABC transporter substrate-binding protein [Paenibacillus sp. GCM10012307]|uniref:ABC transporter substrate-binding protein n=1 Tax=Paenibacillus roseus TaxID=2798579 RepID=A0A934J390_9BACL|nr:ABC transporter substrate-binding protein [Paenibacillus roseus]MBJ6360036.1 ABC transporter substrate-binding protein [Paenibacillus roseus]
MNKKSLIVTMLTILTVAMLLGACGGGKSSTAAPDSTGNKGSASAGTEGEKLKPYEVVIAFYGNDQADLQAVQDEMSKITEEKFNATVKLMPISLSAWAQQTNLMLAGNEKVDIILTSTLFNYASQVAKGQLKPLNELLDKYGEGIKSALDPYQLAASQIKGENYAVANVRDMAAYYGINMRKDLVDKYNIDITKIKTIQDLDAVFKIIKENEPDVVPLVSKNPGTAPFTAGYTTYDPLGGGIGVLPNYDNNLKVVDWFETKEYEEQLKLLRSWYEQGYILKDAATSKQDGRELVKAGKAFSFLSNMKPGSDQENSRRLGKEFVSAALTEAYMTTDLIDAVMWSIPKNSADPERAMMVLNLLYSDKDFYNLFAWGIENKHYIKKSDNVIDYPQGVDLKNIGYNFSTPYMFGNQFLSYTWSTEEPDIYKKIAEFNKTATRSKGLGFLFDVEQVKTEVAAVNNVTSEYRLGLETGTLDPVENLPKFIEKLKASGIDKIIAEKQKQLDEWAKTK